MPKSTLVKGLAFFSLVVALPAAFARPGGAAAFAADPISGNVKSAGGKKGAISVEQIEKDVRWLADDARQGRGILTPGLDEAADYIAKRFEELGLKPIDGLEGYFQPFERDFGQELNTEKTTLFAKGAEGLKLGEDFNPLSWSTPGQFEEELVFAGYGITSERYDWDDYADVDVEGKVALVLRYEPHKEGGQSFFTNSEQFSPEAALFAKARDAEEAGAKALLIVDPPMHHEEDVELMEFGTGRQRADIPVFHVTREAANKLLAAAGLEDLEALQKEIDESAAPASEETALEVSGGLEAEQRTVNVKNVIGLLPGKKADEYIVVGSHYDHVGLGSYGSSSGFGEIHNGADDNASGTTAMLALAEAFAKRGEKPERSIVFVAFTAEEIGLVGSAYMTDNPPVPLEETVAMVNMDMVGRVRDDTLFVGGMDMAPAYRGMLEEADERSPLKLDDMGSAFGGRSDHANFNRKKIPSIFFFSGLHEEYHKPTDDADLVNFEGIAQASRLAYEVIEELTIISREELTFTEPGGREMMEDQPTTRRGADQQETPRRVRLGVMPSLEQSDEPGVLVSAVSENTPAAAAGLRPGDRIIRVNDREITSLEDLQGALVEAEPGDKATIVVKRDGTDVRIEVTFDAAGD